MRPKLKNEAWLPYLNRRLALLESKINTLLEDRISLNKSVKVSTDCYRNKITKLLKLNLSAGTEAFLIGVQRYMDNEGCISPKQAGVVDQIVGEYSE